jgi:hypothetical protein
MGKKSWRGKGRNTTKVDSSKKGEVEKRKQMQGRRVRKAVWDQVGRISSRGSYQRLALGNGTTNTVWGKSMEVGAPTRAVATCHYWEGCLLAVRRQKRGFHTHSKSSSLLIFLGCSSTSAASLICVYIPRCSRGDLGVLEFYEMVMVEPTFCHRWFVWLSTMYVPVVFFYSAV